MKNDFEGINNLSYLPVCHSTNDWAYETIKKGTCLPNSVFVSDYQTKGRGQQGAVWESNAGENLTFSYVLLPKNWRQEELVALNWAVPLAIIDMLSKNGIKASIKWPNDIVIERKKLGGILIESGWKGTFVGHVIVGIGLNINQIEFSNERATSLRRWKNIEWSRKYLLIQIIQNVHERIQYIDNKEFINLKKDFERNLYGINESLWFETGNRWQGRIKGVDHLGRLEIIIGDEIWTFSNKEIMYVF